MRKISYADFNAGKFTGTRPYEGEQIEVFGQNHSDIFTVKGRSFTPTDGGVDIKLIHDLTRYETVVRIPFGVWTNLKETWPSLFKQLIEEPEFVKFINEVALKAVLTAGPVKVEVSSKPDEPDEQMLCSYTSPTEHVNGEFAGLHILYARKLRRPKYDVSEVCYRIPGKEKYIIAFARSPFCELVIDGNINPVVWEEVADPDMFRRKYSVLRKSMLKKVERLCERFCKK